MSCKNFSFCIIHTRKAELRRAVEERRKRRHHEGDGNESYDENKEKRRRTSSTNSQKSDKADGHSSGDYTIADLVCFHCTVIIIYLYTILILSPCRIFSSYRAFLLRIPTSQELVYRRVLK